MVYMEINIISPLFYANNSLEKKSGIRQHLVEFSNLDTFNSNDKAEDALSHEELDKIFENNVI